MKRLHFYTLAFLALSSTAPAQVSSSKHFTIQKLSDRVYAAISSNGGHAICNAGIIDLGNSTLIFDPFMTPEAAEDLKRVAFQLTGHQVKYVINSHFHNDHIGGNQVFDDAIIISTEQTRTLIAKYQPQEIAEDKTEAPPALEAIQKKDTTKMTHHELDENTMWRGYYEALVTSNDSLKTIVPTETFNGQLSIYGTNITVNLLSYGKGHTASDLFLYIPEDRIAFLGDLLFVQNQPWIGDGDPVAWSAYLDSIVRLKPKILVPGHGPVGNLSNLDTMKLYFRNIKDAAIACHKKNILPENITTLKSPPPYNNWFLSNFYKANVIAEYHFLYKK